MAYLKRNINLLLLIICILLIGFTLTVTTYSQSQFENITVQYYDRVNEQNAIIEELEARDQALNETSTELTRKTQDTQRLNELFTETEAEKDSIQSELQATKQDLAVVRSQLTAAQKTISSQTVQIDQLENDIDKYDAKVESLVDAVADAKSDADGSPYMCSQVSDLFEEIDDVTDDLESYS